MSGGEPCFCSFTVCLTLWERVFREADQRAGRLAIEVVKLLVKPLMKLYQTGPMLNQVKLDTKCANSNIVGWHLLMTNLGHSYFFSKFLFPLAVSNPIKLVMHHINFALLLVIKPHKNHIAPSNFLILNYASTDEVCSFSKHIYMNPSLLIKLLKECKWSTDGVARQHRDREILVRGATSPCWPSP
jgi:hypothetical protein